MNRALWSKAVADARLLLTGLMILMFGFHWLFVWLTTLIELGLYASLLESLPDTFVSLTGLPMNKLATPTGRIAMAYLEPVVIFAMLTWGLARGSDAVSGEIGRGTMEMLLAQPVSRMAVLFSHAVVTMAGAALLGLAAWLGTCQGLAVVGVKGRIEPAHFVPGALNVFALTFFLGAITTLASSAGSYRWRTIGAVGAFYVVELILKLVARLSARFHWLMYCTFLGAYEPQVMIASPERAWEMSLRYDGTLLGLGLAAYVGAAVIFQRRDLPAPL